MESRVLPDADISAILSKFVCVKVDIDNPGPAQKILSQVTGNTLPFYAFTTPDGKFVKGTSGFRDVSVFKADLEGVMKHDLLRAPAAAEKKLAKIAEQAAKDFEAKKVAAVVKAAKDADLVPGFSDSKDKVKDLLAQVLTLGREKMKEAAGLCKDAKFDEAGAIVEALSKDYKGTELERGATASKKALDRFKSAGKETDPKAAKRHYEAVIKDCKDAPPFLELAEAKLKE